MSIHKKRKAILIVMTVLMVPAGIVGGLLYTSSKLENDDESFLLTKPSEERLLERFGKPSETLLDGQTFPDTGWRPLPQKAAAPKAYSFMRPLKRKVYIFIDSEGRVVRHIMAGS